MPDRPPGWPTGRLAFAAVQGVAVRSTGEKYMSIWLAMTYRTNATLGRVGSISH